jgi:cystathionine gamma-synthase
MTPKIQTAKGYGIPPAPRHSITVHWPGWEAGTRMRDIKKNPGILQEMHSMYPRVKIHQDVVEVRSPPAPRPSWQVMN